MESDAIQVILARDVPTDVGILAAGTTLLAVPAVDKPGWLVELSLPRFGVPAHPVTIKPRSVREGLSMLRSLYAHHDYRFAREVLGYGHLSAIAWISHGYRVGERQLIRWGFTNLRTEVAA